MTTVPTEVLNRHKQAFTEFLDAEDNAHYADECRQMCENKKRRLVVSMNDLRDHDPELARGLLRRPSEHLPAFESALRDYISNLDPSYAKSTHDFFVGVEGSLGANQVSPRGLLCHLLNQLVCVEGIVIRCTAVHPKVVRTVHHCAKTGQFESREYHDLTSNTGLPTGSAYPTKDKDGNLLTTEYGLSIYRDHQRVSIQEMPERCPPGQLPRCVDVLLENELVDACRPGDRVRAGGIFRALPSKAQTSTGMVRTVVLGNHVRVISKEAAMPTMTREDVRNIKRLAKSKDLIPEFTRSLAPSVYGHDNVKQALLLMLLGGVEKNLPNGTHLRGDINVLMVGDPSTAKSQILRFAMQIAPLAISTTGRGASGVGLTAAVTTDQETGEKRLEAGAMVLADRGVCCIDEFDKMLQADRVAIHEVMEQQTITIAKAGIHASLNARTSVLAAANPVYGRYNTERSPMDNVGLPDSLLSRFDLLFIVLDARTADLDRSISGHVLQMHRTSKAGTVPAALSAVGARGGDVVEDVEEAEDADGLTPMYVKFERGTLQAGPGGRRGRGKVVQQVLSAAFIKKFVHYAKQKHAPVMTKEASSKVASEYAAMRQRAKGTETRSLPVTPRTLETIIRLSTSFAKLHLRDEVLEEDVESALDLLNSELFKDIPKDKRNSKSKARAKGDAGDGADADDGDDGDDDDDAGRGDGDGGRGAGSKAAEEQDAASAGRDASSSEGDKENRVAKRQRTAGGATRQSGGAPLTAAEDVDVDPDTAPDAEEEGVEGTATAEAEDMEDEEDEMDAALDDEPLPEGLQDRVLEAVGDLAVRNRGEDRFSIATVFAAVADLHAARGMQTPTMRQLRALLATDSVKSTLMLNDGLVMIL